MFLFNIGETSFIGLKQFLATVDEYLLFGAIL